MFARFTVLTSALAVALTSTAEALPSAPLAMDATMCAASASASMPESLRARLAVAYGEALAVRSCARFFDSSGEEIYSRLAVTSVPLQPDEIGLLLFGFRLDGGWTDLTPSGLPSFNPSKDKVWIEPSEQGKMPRLLLEIQGRASQEIILLYEPDAQLYQAFSDQPRWQGD